jgi:HK97 family phage major capsid protein
LKAVYSQNAVWLMNRTTFGQLRKFKTTTGEYLFAEGTGLVAGAPGTIVGRPVLMAPDMPDVAAGSIPVLLGDFSRGYAVLDKAGGGGLTVMRDPFTQALNGKVRFHTRLRVGGGTIQPEAMVGVQVST